MGRKFIRKLLKKGWGFTPNADLPNRFLRQLRHIESAQERETLVEDSNLPFGRVSASGWLGSATKRDMARIA